MHIYPNNNLVLASLGSAREETQDVQAKRAGGVRRRLSIASGAVEFFSDEYTGGSTRVERRTYEASEQEQLPDEDDGFGRLFSAKA